MTDTSPTVRRRELGKRLRQLRKECGLTVEDVAEELGWSVSKISRFETRNAIGTSASCAYTTTPISGRGLSSTTSPESKAGGVSMRISRLICSRVRAGWPKVSGASPCTSYRRYCKPKTMGKTSQAATVKQGRGQPARNCRPVSRSKSFSSASHTSEVLC